jgi:ribosomal protein L40E
MAQRPSLPDDHVFPDGMTLRNVRDAVVAATKIGMWHTAYEMAERHGMQKKLCLKCAKTNLNEQEITYFAYRGLSIRICRKCKGNDTTLR